MHVKIAGLEKVQHQETQTDFLDLTFEIYEGKKLIASHKEALPVSSKKKDIEKAAQIYLDGYIRDEEQRKANEENEKLNKHVSTLQEELIGSELGEANAPTK